jgi:hypothetical protein
MLIDVPRKLSKEKLSLGHRCVVCVFRHVPRGRKRPIDGCGDALTISKQYGFQGKDVEEADDEDPSDLREY